MAQGVSTFVTGPSGQQVILGPSAAAALFDQNKQTPAPSSRQQQHKHHNGYSFPQAASASMRFSTTANSMTGSENTNSSTGGGGTAMMNVPPNNINNINNINSSNNGNTNDAEVQRDYQASNDTLKHNVNSTSSLSVNKSSKRKVDSSSGQLQKNQQGGSIESSSFEQQQQRSKNNCPQQQQWTEGGGGEEVSAIAPIAVSADSYASNKNNMNNNNSGETAGSYGLPPRDCSVNNNHSTTLGNILQNSMMMPNSHYPKIDTPMEMACNDKFKPGDRRRQERNLREQARSHKISQQIKALRDVLSESKVPFKANKYSILTSVADYIKQLQSHAVLLDGEHKKLINTIRKTTEMVNSGSVPQVSSSGGRENITPGNAGSSCNNSATNNDGSNDVVNDDEMLLVQGLDYQTLFHQCSAALGVVALDGRFLACNAEFQNIIGFTKEQLEKKSLFDLLANRDADEFFGLLNTVFNKGNDTGDNSVEVKETLNGNGGLWSGIISRPQQSFQVNITVTRSTQGIPKFFNCALFEASDNGTADNMDIGI